MQTREEVEQHIRYKHVTECTLSEPIARHMLDALEAGAEPDYQVLLKAAKWPGLPNPAYHTTSRALRSTIFLNGLRMWMPQNGNWSRLICEADQPTGVYVAPDPDEHGVWSHWGDDFDVWVIDTTDLPHTPDLLNPGSYCITTDVPETRLTLWEKP